MTWGLNLDGTLSDDLQERFVELVVQHGKEYAQSAGRLTELAQTGQITSIDAAFPLLDAALASAGRISSTIRPGNQWNDHPQLRKARRSFMTDLFSHSDIQIVHRARDVRHAMEHFDEKLEAKIASVTAPAAWINLVGPRSTVDPSSGMQIIWLRHYDPATATYTILDQTINMNRLGRGVRTAMRVADAFIAAKRAERDTSREDPAPSGGRGYFG